MGHLIKRNMCCRECGKLFDISINAKIYQNETELRDKISRGGTTFI